MVIFLKKHSIFVRNLIFLGLFLLVSCQKTESITDHLVVEGWIEQGKAPVVLLHRSFNTHAPHDPDKWTLEEIASDLIVAFGKVTVSDGTDSVILTGRLDTNYVMPYIYTTINMEGEVGKTYTLRAEYKNYVATASTTIRQAPKIDSICIMSTLPDIAVAMAYISVPKTTEKTYYAVFYRAIGQPQFQLCPFGTFDSSLATDGIVKQYIYQMNDEGVTFGNFDKTLEKSQYFLKVAQIGETEYKIYTNFSEQFASQGTYFLSAYGNIASNISGGYGYWCGLGSTECAFDIQKDCTFVY